VRCTRTPSDDTVPEPTTDNLTRRVAAAAGWAQVSRLAEVFSSLALSLLLVRALGPTNYGQYSFLVNAATFAAIALSLGFPDTVMRFVSAFVARGEEAEARYLVRRLALVRLVVYGIGVLLLLGFHGPLAGALHLPLVEQYWVALAALLVSQGAIEFSTSNAYARLDPRDVAVARTVGQILALAFFAVVVLLGRPDPASAALTIVISYVAATLILLGRGLGQTLFTGRASRTPLAPVARFAGAAWGGSLFTLGLAGQIDVILLGVLRHDAVQIAYYSVATLIYVKVGILLSGWAGTAISSFAEVQTRRGLEGVKRYFVAYVRLHLLLALVVYPPLILLSVAITRGVFGPAYAPAAGLMAVYGVMWLASAFLAAGIPYSSMLALGSQRQAVAIRATTGVLNVVLDVVLIPPLGALGAIIATGIANLAAHIGDFVVAARQVNANYPWRFAARTGFAALVASVPALLLRPDHLLPAALVTVLYLGLFGAVLSVLRPLTPADATAAGRLNPRLGAVVERMVDR
jgi:O-antigen/teichoic acid export membrane protein